MLNPKASTQRDGGILRESAADCDCDRGFSDGFDPFLRLYLRVARLPNGQLERAMRVNAVQGQAKWQA
jgi:hypothetical protein